MRGRQLQLFTKKRFPNLSGLELEFGGNLRKGKRKIARPIDPKRAMHVVLRSSRARGAWFMLRKRNQAIVRAVLRHGCERFGVKVLGQANVGNHLHLVLKARTRRDFQGFMRMVAGRIAALVTGARKGGKAGRFWDSLAYSRVVNWGRDLLGLRHYLAKNALEGPGIELMTASGAVRKFFLRNGRLVV